MCTKASRSTTEFIDMRKARSSSGISAERKKERTKAVLEQQKALTGMIIIICELLDVCWRMSATRSGDAKHNTSRNSISLVLDVCRRRSATGSRRIEERHICSPACVLEKVCYQI
jgi:hypothetical protein